MGIPEDFAAIANTLCAKPAIAYGRNFPNGGGYPNYDQAFFEVRILDFSQSPRWSIRCYAVTLTDVIKVEQPVTGDSARGLMNNGEDESMSPSFGHESQ